MENALDITLAVVLPLLATVLTTIAIPAAVAWLQANKVIKSAEQAKILQSALENAALTALARAGGAKTALGGAKTVPLDAAIAYMRTSVPDTLDKLHLDDGTIRDLVLPHVQKQIEAVRR